MNLDPDGKPFRMLVFNDTGKSGDKILLVDEMLHDYQDLSKNRIRPIRAVPQVGSRS